MRRQLPLMTFLENGPRRPNHGPRVLQLGKWDAGGRFGYALARYSAHAWLLLVLPDLVRTSAHLRVTHTPPLTT